ncbi:MAG TPA: DUF4382 domain-containing protein [Gammaproteobacteria bacterium]|jgi:hypothetical protein
MRHLALFLAFGLLALSGCGGSDGGHVNFDITDSPADGASKVVVEFTGLTATPDAGPAIHYSYPQALQLDMASLHSGATASLLQNLQLPAGHYKSLTLDVSATPGAHDSFVVDATGKHALVLNGSSMTVPGGFDVQADEGSSFLIDLDLRRSVLPAGGGDFRLAPAARMLDERAAGNIVGSVPGTLASAAGCVPVVYVFAGDNAAPHDLDATAPAATQPVTEAPVQMDTDFGAFRFTAAYLKAGAYTLAFTCDAGHDDPSKPDAITFSPVGSVVAEAGATTLTALH